MIVATAMAVEGETYDVGNHNTWIELSDDIPVFFERWFQAGPGHHFAIAYGDHARRIGILAQMLDVECEKI